MQNALLIEVRLKNAKYSGNTLDELQKLAETARINPKDSIMVKVSKFHPATLLGKGKLEEIRERIARDSIDSVIFDNDISPRQQRNLENETGIRVMDRTSLILGIFSMRARTSEGKLQVKLAQFSYNLSRLTGKGTTLEQQKGMIGTRGPGERKMEYDRRVLKDKIAGLKKEIESIKKERGIQRRMRNSIPMPQISIVGYTNSGKSTLLNCLTSGRHNVYADDKLFATLDPAVKRVKLPSGGWALCTDTVGFIQKLPHHLIASFRATIEEITFSDLIIHVHDLSSPYMSGQHAEVEKILKELKTGSIPVINAYNKIDLAPDLNAYQKSLGGYHPVFFSALTGENIDRLLKRIEEALSEKWIEVEISLPPDKTGLLKDIYECCLVKNAAYGDKNIKVRLKATRENYRRILNKISRPFE
ncbi:MAG: GTPase HflX [Elusimicrobia bacterium]|nr:GTPase HflX [Elusimicrobiota bacterium]